MENKNVKIVHVTSAHQYDDTRILLKECVSLSKNRYDVSLVHSGNVNKEINGVKIIGINYTAKNRFSRFYKTVNKIL